MFCFLTLMHDTHSTHLSVFLSCGHNHRSPSGAAHLSRDHFAMLCFLTHIHGTHYQPIPYRSICPSGTYASGEASSCTPVSMPVHVAYCSSTCCETVKVVCTICLVHAIIDKWILLCQRCCWRYHVFSTCWWYDVFQCPLGSFSARGASVCTACIPGKYLVNAAGGTEAASCISVRRALPAFTWCHQM